MNKDALLKKIQMFDFALQEAALFLDSHPNDVEAIQYYQKYRKLKDQATSEFESCLGPLSNRSNQGDQWEYVYGPWPWEGEE